ncbi:MAG: methyl-accepting chemotaxis protein [Bacteriovorax sp.]|nr:methyl-accepting chemotaxis protein [Bacteriovorax sp.]
MKNLSLRLKLYSLASMLILFVMVVGITGYWSSYTIAKEYSKIAKFNFPNTSNLLEEFTQIHGRRVQLLQLIMPGTTDAQDLKALKKMEEHKIMAKQYEKAYLEIPFTSVEEVLYNEFRAAEDKLDKDYDKELELYGKNKSETSPERKEMIDLATNAIDEHADQLKEVLKKLLDFHKDDAKKNIAAASAAEKTGLLLVNILVVAAIIIGGIFAFLLSRSLVKTFSELGTSLANSGDQVSSAATQIASASEELSQATTQQAASLQETSSSIEEISSMINANTENAKQSSTVSAQSLVTAERGKEVVEHMIRAIGDINTSNIGIMNQIDETNKEIENIVKIINEIGSKTKVINDIVFQTKLLSFNASVEAARAGEQGKGFAVVAEEVGNLAAMSGAAALEISNMLEGSIKSVEGIVRNSKEKIGKLILNGKEKVETGTRVAHDCEEVLNEIVLSVASVSKMIAEISSASQEQAQGVHEITKAIAQLDQVTQQNTANSAESANAAGTLSSQAEMLNSLVQELVQTIEGGAKINKQQLIQKNSIQVNKKVTPTRPTENKPKENFSSNTSNSLSKNEIKTTNTFPSHDDSRFEEI